MRSSTGCRKSICLPFASEADYQACLPNPEAFRAYVNHLYAQSPELFPKAMNSGFTFHSLVTSQKLKLTMRRIELKANQAVYQLRPSFAMPYMIGKTDELEKALYLCQWGIPFDALAYVFGRDAGFWYRAYLSLGRPSLVGTTVKDPDRLPRDLVADEKHSWRLGERIYLPTTVADGVFLGIGMAQETGTIALTKAYQEFKAGAPGTFRQLHPTHRQHRWLGSDSTRLENSLSQGDPQVVFSPRRLDPAELRCRSLKALFAILTDKV